MRGSAFISNAVWPHRQLPRYLLKEAMGGNVEKGVQRQVGTNFGNRR